MSIKMEFVVLDENGIWDGTVISSKTYRKGLMVAHASEPSVFLVHRYFPFFPDERSPVFVFAIRGQDPLFGPFPTLFDARQCLQNLVRKADFRRIGPRPHERPEPCAALDAERERLASVFPDALAALEEDAPEPPA